MRSRLLSWLGTAISGTSMGGVTRCPASLQRLDALKRPMDVEQLALQRLMQTLNLPRIVGEWILVSRWATPCGTGR